MPSWCVVDKVQKRVMRWSIKFPPLKPRSTHLNAKVERSQMTDLDQFYATVPLDNPSTFSTDGVTKVVRRFMSRVQSRSLACSVRKRYSVSLFTALPPSSCAQ
jgi:hypothetical protein